MPFMERALPVFSLEFTLQIFLILVSTSGLIWVLWREVRASNRPFLWLGARGGQVLEFLFENGVLIDCNAAAKGVLAQQGLSGTSWASISRLLRQQLGDLPMLGQHQPTSAPAAWRSADYIGKNRPAVFAVSSADG